ncbi:carboxymuconolactone decarboxylase family protein [Engelhardtia mirabilis]|uniref:carboxymuconolactone decarboxylase family protein n=1 Tax=Engelhardtia mirabilis TaxID=2528011 RepID=UPI0011AA80A4
MTESSEPAWIETVPAEAWTGELAELRGTCADRETGKVDHVLLVHSLNPRGLRGHLAVYGAAMAGTRGLRKVDRELIALSVSQLNGCHY